MFSNNFPKDRIMYVLIEEVIPQLEKYFIHEVQEHDKNSIHNWRSLHTISFTFFPIMNQPHTTFVDEHVRQVVWACKSLDDLKVVIKEYAPFVSYSRVEPVEYTAEQLLIRVNNVFYHGWPINLITRAGWLRDKVIELLNDRAFAKAESDSEEAIASQL